MKVSCTERRRASFCGLQRTRPLHQLSHTVQNTSSGHRSEQGIHYKLAVKQACVHILDRKRTTSYNSPDNINICCVALLTSNTANNCKIYAMEVCYWTKKLKARTDALERHSRDYDTSTALRGWQGANKVLTRCWQEGRCYDEGNKWSAKKRC